MLNTQFPKLQQEARIANCTASPQTIY